MIIGIFTQFKILFKCMYRKTCLKINVDNCVDNVKMFADHTHKKVMGIVKANAYGLIDYELSKHLEKSGVDFFGVSSLEEAMRLRKHGIKSEILILSYIHDINKCKENNLSVIIPNRHFIEEHKQELNNLKVHIKLNTGLNRLGINPKEINEVIKDLLSYGALIEGVMTHYACAENIEYTEKQYKIFEDAVKSCGYQFKYIHTCATDAALHLKDEISNYVRIGLGISGVASSKPNIPLKPALTFCAEVIDCKQIEKGEGISYQHNYITDGNGYYLTCAIGYADGIDLKYSGKEVYVEDEVGMIVGNICMDLMVVKVNKPHKIGSQIEILGEHMDMYRRVQEIGGNAQKIMTDISDRVTRQYYINGKLDNEITERFDR